MNRIVDEIKRQFNQPNNATIQLIIINLIIFAFINIGIVISKLFHLPIDFELFTYKYLALSDVSFSLLYRPWTIITNAFTQVGFWHLLSNMVGLYFLGRFFASEFGDRRLIGFYLMTAVLNSFLYIIVQNVIPLYAGSSTIIGASGVIFGLLVALAAYYPNHEVRLYFFIPIKLYWLAVGLVVLSFIQMVGNNGGGNASHLTGALIGYLYAWQLKKGTNWGEPFSLIVDFFGKFFKKKSPKMNVSYSRKGSNHSSTVEDVDYTEISQEEIDDILDKLRVSGYESLSKAEKDKLFEYSKK